MRDSADSYEYGVTRRGKRGKFNDDESVYGPRRAFGRRYRPRWTEH
jgi:hypothetical protein